MKWLSPVHSRCIQGVVRRVYLRFSRGYGYKCGAKEVQCKGQRPKRPALPLVCEAFRVQLGSISGDFAEVTGYHYRAVPVHARSILEAVHLVLSWGTPGALAGYTCLPN